MEMLFKQFLRPFSGMMFAEGADGGQGGDGGAGDGSGANGNGSGNGQGGAQGGSGQAPADWRSGLDPEIKDHPCLKDFKSEKEVAKAYVNAQHLIGVEKLPIPPKNAKPEVREKFLNEAFDRLGRPKEAKDYKIPEVKGLKIDQAKVDTFKQLAHKLGLLPHQLEGLYNYQISEVMNASKLHSENTQKQINEVTAQLKNEWGEAFDAKLAKAEKVVDTFASDEEKAYLIQSGFNRDPRIIKMLNRIGEAISEDSFVKNGGEATMTPKEALAEIAKIDANPAFLQAQHPEHKALVTRRQELYAMAYPK